MRECSQGKTPSIPTHLQVPASPVKAAPKFASLPSKYDLPDHPIYRQARVETSTDEEEFLKYKNARLSPEETDLVSFWEVSNSLHFIYSKYNCFVQQISRHEYPKLFRVAMNYLPIQASSVPCEHVFSSAGETDTKRRNRISPVLMEALQILKFIYKKDRLNFTAGFKTMDERVVNSNSKDLLAELFLEDAQDATDKLLHVLGGDDSGED